MFALSTFVPYIWGMSEVTPPPPPDEDAEADARAMDNELQDWLNEVKL